MIAKIMDFDILLKYLFFDNGFYSKLLVLCSNMVLLLEYMVLVAIYIIPGYNRIHILVINVRLVYKIIYKLALFSILLFKCKLYS